MQKVTVFIVSSILVALAAAFFGGAAMAAQVAWVNESKARVHINGGTNDGYVVGTIVCFYISTRERLACGVVESASDSKAVVKVEKRWGKRILKGTEAILLYAEEDEKEVKEKENLPDSKELKEKEDRKDTEKKPEKADWFQ
jgi:hypothetical protein